MHLDSYTPFNYAYLDVESTREDVDLTPEMIESVIGMYNPDQYIEVNPETKYYLHWFISHILY